MRRVGLFAVGVWLALACSGGGSPGGGSLYTPECCKLTGGGVTTLAMEYGQSDCASAGGTWVTDPDCEVVCCADPEGHGYMTKGACAQSGGSEVDAASVCGE